MGTEKMSQLEETEEKISNHLEEWLQATQRSPINKSVGGFLRSAAPALNILAKTRVAAFIYDYENGGYSYFNDYFPILLNSTRKHIEKVGIRVMQERVHPEDFIKCLNLTRRTLE
jgi:predicted N-acyltransferase